MLPSIASFRSRSPLARESLRLLASLVVGVVPLPIAVYWTGVKILGPYTGGGFWAYWGDFFRGLAHGEWSWWLLAAGPYVLLLFVRAVRSGWHLTAH